MPRNPGVPHYERLVARLLHGSISLEDGGRLPSERALARRYGVARNTARRALQELEARGSVLRLRGSGTFRTSHAARTVLGYGYRLEHEPFSRFFRVLSQKLAAAGLHLAVRDMGLTGERFHMAAELPDVQRAEAVVMMASSHPEGLRTMVRFRRRFPNLLPLLLISESLGLKLQGRHRFDFIHYDFRDSARALVRNLLARGCRRPVFIARTDTTIFTAQEALGGFCDELREREMSCEEHCLTWDPGDLSTLRRSPVLRGGTSRPDAFVMTHGYDDEFRRVCHSAGVALSADAVFASVGESRRRYLNSAVLARLCADLLLNRLGAPNRPNLHLTLAIPEKFRRPF